MNVQKHLSILGYRARDRVTGFEGVVTSVCFDLYGCIQVVLNPGIRDDGKIGEQLWFDINRLIVAENKPRVMAPQTSSTGQLLRAGTGRQRSPA
ncbi:hypothetical protein KUU78_06790 [Pseudomonas aeruginosa]|uniref:hypothetical protein n=1 Tax=Pseudomonas aeruginosa TaxID=287 RepID=UPI001A1F8A05|nr:hypothetical protein [Pseudomonas aeruginosa]MBH3652268.1 hypothetical protein [Pseudomonas aeruginosa]MBY9205030.1 hypothetical protein [Pseudomonas aeruginosa]MBY9624707.1 hypothetical protein [Pseudomonas aeruginosa]MBY9751244.1 hypothetical protein [Pseudomonas aeruginosa]MCA6844471.1 hypothetical protein [Pseudomonas aeruginosa]